MDLGPFAETRAPKFRRSGPVYQVHFLDLNFINQNNKGKLLVYFWSEFVDFTLNLGLKKNKIVRR